MIYTGNADQLVRTIEDEASRIRRNIDTMGHEEIRRRAADIENCAQRLRNDLNGIQGQANQLETKVRQLEEAARGNR